MKLIRSHDGSSILLFWFRRHACGACYYFHVWMQRLRKTDMCVWGEGRSAPPPRKPMKDVSETAFCYLEIGPLWKFWPTCKKFGQNRRNWDFTLTWLTKIPVTRSIFETWGSSFIFSLIFCVGYITKILAKHAIKKFFDTNSFLPSRTSRQDIYGQGCIFAFY